MAYVEHQELELLRSRVNRLQAEVDFLYRHLGVTFVESAQPGDDPRIIDALRKGNVLEAIKYYREVTNSDLSQAKAAVEAMRGRLGL